MKILWQVKTGHTLPYFHINEDEKSKPSHTNFDFVHNSIYIFHSVPSPIMGPKMLVGAYQRHLAMTPADANFEVAVFHEPQINPQAHGIPL